jgi:hypothetical protein
MKQDLVTRAATLLGRASRGGAFFDRATAVGAAFAIAPLQYATRPLSADEINLPDANCTGNLTPSQCRKGECAPDSLCCREGWTAFCCQLPDESNYGCPSYAFIAGWWRCSQRVEDTGICGRPGETHHRFYIDCNVKPGMSCPGGCACGHGRCGTRRACCNCFRYGQCNQQVGGTTYVVCRLVSCVGPWAIGCGNCAKTPDLSSDATCSHPVGIPCFG